MERKKLDEILASHLAWLKGEGDGERADLRSADLRSADLRDADLRGANLRGANLRDANLRDANLDFSCWPLWCGSKGVKVDARIVRQLVMHLLWLDSDCSEMKALRRIKTLEKIAAKCHRA